MSLRDAGQLPATPLTSPHVSPSGSTHDAVAAATASPDTQRAVASWNQGGDSADTTDAVVTVVTVNADQQAAANTAAQKITAPSVHWRCPSPGTAGATMIAVHSAATGIYAFGSGLLIYFTVEATKACLATLDSDPSAATIHRANAIACGVGAGAFFACGMAWGLKYLKSSIEQGVIRHHA